MKQQWNIHRCLSELKTLDNRISKKISNLNQVDYKKNSAEKTYKTKSTIKDFEESVKAELDSITQLISNRNKIKNAVVLSNASTKVTISGKEYTVAEAIERKNSITLERSLITRLVGNYKLAMNTVNSNNQEAELKAESQVNAILGSDAKTEEKLETMKKVIENNSWSLIDPVDTVKLVEEMTTEVEAFETEVDYILSVSNATTVVEIDLDEVK